jgi:hypothetical protein
VYNSITFLTIIKTITSTYSTYYYARRDVVAFIVLAHRVEVPPVEGVNPVVLARQRDAINSFIDFVGV